MPSPSVEVDHCLAHEVDHPDTRADRHRPIYRIANLVEVMHQDDRARGREALVEGVELAGSSERRRVKVRVLHDGYELVDIPGRHCLGRRAASGTIPVGDGHRDSLQGELLLPSSRVAVGGDFEGVPRPPYRERKRTLRSMH
jgi:hypothetical protein